jgi:multiple sugar transport system substrate-binding protein
LAAGAGAPLALGRAARAQAKPEKLAIMCHAVHRGVVTAAKGGDSAAEWSQANGVKLEWLTFGVPEVHDRLYREASLSRGSVDLGLVANRYIGPKIATMFEPLDGFQQRAPIEAFDDIAQGMRETMTYDGKLYGIPFRHATSGLHYNKAILAERGLSGPPRTIEELISYAEKLTFRRGDGTQVHGLVLDGTSPAQIIDIVRAWNGDFLSADYRILATEPPMIRTVALLKDFYAKQVLPRTWTRFQTEDTLTFMSQGRAAMAITPFGRYTQFNDPARSKVAGQVEVVPVPISETLKSRFAVAPAKTEFWAFVIPKNTPNKDLAWDLVRHFSSKENTVRAAMNGNGPCRTSTYADARYREALPYAEAEGQVLALARPPLPGWDEAAKAEDIFREELEAVLVAGKTPEAAMQSVAARVAPLLPK